MNKIIMKEFTTQEIMGLLNRVMVEEISFTRMVEIMNERVSKSDETQFKDGDFVVNVCGAIIIFKNKVEDSIYDHAYFDELGWTVVCSDAPSATPIKGYATEEEKKKILDALAKEGKRWNEEKKCVEDIPVRKFQNGDKVRIKHGISSETVHGQDPVFQPFMDDFIGTTMTVSDYTPGGYVVCDESYWRFNEDWLEPYSDPQYKNGDFVVGLGCMFIVHKQIDENSVKYHVLYAKTNGKLWYDKIYWQKRGIDKSKLATEAEKQEFLDALAKEGKRWNEEKKCIEDIPEELKKGDLAIFWDSDQSEACIRVYNRFYDGLPFPHIDHIGNSFRNAIKFESTEQYEKLLKEEL